MSVPPQFLTLQPNWKSPVLERWEYKTDIIRSRSSIEQRIKLRDQPRQTLEYEFMIYRRDLQQFQSRLFAAQGDMWDVPLWQHMQILKQPVSEGATTIACDTDGYEFQISPGTEARGVFWKNLTPLALNANAEDLQAFKITGIGSNSLTIQGYETIKACAEGTWLVPVKKGYLRDNLSLRWITAEVAIGTVQISIVDPVIPEATVMYPAIGNHVLLAEPNRANPEISNYTRESTILDYGTGVTKTYDRYGYSDQIDSNEYVITDRPGVKVYREILSSLKGAYGSFYSPSFNTACSLATDAVQGGTSVTILNVGIADLVYNYFNQLTRPFVPNTPPLLDFWIETNTDTSYWIQVNGATASGDRETLTLSGVFAIRNGTLTHTASLPSAIPVDSVKRITFMNKYRLESDSVEFAWITPSVATLNLRLRKIVA